MDCIVLDDPSSDIDVPVPKTSEMVDDSDDSLPDIFSKPLAERLIEFQNRNEKVVDLSLTVVANKGTTSTRVRHDISVSDDDSLPDFDSQHSKPEKPQSKEQKRAQKQAKLLEKEDFKKSREAQREIARSELPANCFKYVTAVIDNHLLEIPGSDDLISALNSSEIKHSVEEQPLPNIVTWSKDSDALLEKQVLAVVHCDRFMTLVQAEQMDDSDKLSDFIRQILDIFSNPRLTVVVFQSEKYFKKQVSRKNKEYRDALRNAESDTLSQPSQQPNKRSRQKQQTPQLSEIDMNQILIAVQLDTSINFRFVESVSDLAQIVVTFTTAIAQAPHKRQKHQNEGLSWYLLGDNHNTVRVDKDGKGLTQLWIQQIMQFHQVSKDVAQAIVGRYPTPQSLIKAYRNCSDLRQAQLLLQNIEVRRGAGALATTRNVGRELSHKMHLLLTTKNEDDILQS